MNRVKKSKEVFQAEVKEQRLEISIEDQLAKIDRIFAKPRNFTAEEMNEAVLDGDEAKLLDYRTCKTKCHAKRDRIKAELEATADAEARDTIMCKVTVDPNVID